jgi:hypothetical protein
MAMIGLPLYSAITAAVASASWLRIIFLSYVAGAEAPQTVYDDEVCVFVL